MIKTLFHFSKKIREIKRAGYIEDVSYAKTNTYDVLLDVCPEIVLDEDQIRKLARYRRRQVATIAKHLKEQEGESYESKYRELSLTFRNSMLTEFFHQNKYVLAFDEKLAKGWMKWGLFPLISYKIGRKYLTFTISKDTAKKSFVLEQKYWSPIYAKQKFGLNTWDPAFRIENNPKIVKEVFGKYYLSIKRLTDYRKGEYEVPEFWIYGKVSFKECRIGQLSEKTYRVLLEKRQALRKHL